MEMIDKYVFAIGQKLPIKSRNEIKQELTSLLLDEIENKYGKDPTDDEINQTIVEFGTPNKVAKKYSGDTNVIGLGFTDIYFLIMKIIVGALSIAFFTIFIVSLFTQSLAGVEILKAFFLVPIRIIQASFSGIGVLTVIFIIITKLLKNAEVDLEEDWNIKELESITLTEAVESKIESVIAIIFISIFIALINIYPDFLLFLENLFEKSGMTLGNKINIDIFKDYIIVFSLLGMLEVSYHILLLKKEIKTRAMYILDFFTSIFDLVFTITILKIGALFIYTGTNRGLFTTSTIGFKLFMVIGLVTGSFEIISKVINYIKMEIRTKDKL